MEYSYDFDCLYVLFCQGQITFEEWVSRGAPVFEFILNGNRGRQIVTITYNEINSWLYDEYLIESVDYAQFVEQTLNPYDTNTMASVMLERVNEPNYVENLYCSNKVSDCNYMQEQIYTQIKTQHVFNDIELKSLRIQLKNLAKIPSMLQELYIMIRNKFVRNDIEYVLGMFDISLS